MNSLVFVFGLLLLMVSINNGLTPVPTPPPSNNDGSVISTAPTLKPTPSPSPGPTPAPVSGGTPTLKPTTNIGVVPTPHPTSIDGSILTPAPTPRSSSGPAPSPAIVPTFSTSSMVPTRSPINGALWRCISSDKSLDIIFMVDSSGSVYDNDYKNWENELDLVYDIIQNVLPINSRVGLINFSGCGPSFTFEQCKAQNRLKKMISLKDYGSPNDLNSVLSAVDAIDQDDFNGGYTWTEEALGMALEEFVLNMNGMTETNKMIILISDGEPFPYNEGHEPCKTSTGYVSSTLTSLRQLGVAIITVGIDISQEIKNEYFDCISNGNSNFYFDATFDSLSVSPTQNGLSIPSPFPTLSSGTSGLSPVPTANGIPSEKPTPSPTAVASPGSVPTPPPTNTNGSPSEKPTPSPTAVGSSPTSDGSVSTLPTPSPTAGTNTSPSFKPTPSPGTVPSPPPTNAGSASLLPSPGPTPGPTPTPSLDGSGLSPVPTAGANTSPSDKPTPSPTAAVSPGTVPTPPPTNAGSLSSLPTRGPSPPPTLDGSSGLSPKPTLTPTPAPLSTGVVAVEDLSDSIGDFICSELGSTRLIIPTLQPTPMPTYIIQPSSKPTTEPTLGNLKGECSSSSQELDIIFMIDSSSSVYDEEYKNWQSQLDLVNDIIKSLPSDKTRASLINFSGCGASFTFEQCSAEGRLDIVFELDSYGSPTNNLDLVSDRIGAMSSDDFNGGYTWTDEALGLALQQFVSHSIGARQVIVLLTDGEPYPYNEGHEPCLTSNGYISPTLTALNNLGVDIVTIGIDISQEIKDEKLDCISSSYFGVAQFLTLESLSVEIGELICNKVDGSFETMSLAPSMKPTSGPISNIPTISLVPTPSPVSSSMEPTFDAYPISNGMMAGIFNINYFAIIISGFIGYLLF